MILSDDPIPKKRLQKYYKQTRELKQAIQNIFSEACSNLGVMNMAASFAMIVGVLAYTQVVVPHHLGARSVILTQLNEEEVEFRTCAFQESAHWRNYLPEQIEMICRARVYGPTEQELREQHLLTVLGDHPMASMASALSDIDEDVASFIVGIGKIESNWGKRSPWKNGKDCYNYWGYKTSGSRGQALGHACFGSPEEAVATIAKRLDYFVHDRGKDTANKLLVWKCGSSCATHSPEGVARWVSVVDRYARQARTPEGLGQISIVDQREVAYNAQ